MKRTGIAVTLLLSAVLLGSVFATLLPVLASLASGADRAQKAVLDPARADADFRFQGEYVGEVTTDEGQTRFGAQVVALGRGKFYGVGYPGGLPGDGWNEYEKYEGNGERRGDRIVFDTPEGQRADLLEENGKVILRIYDTNGELIGTLDKVMRKSPTLGKKPPEGAIVLFDGTSADRFVGGRMTRTGLLIQGCRSKERFGSAKIHLEFMTPYMPHARGQARGNSGVYVQGRYEIQILDSFGLEGRINECGAIYGVKPPRINMCFPPLSWQTYDIEFHAAKYDASGKKIKNARMTVWHNGVLIHRDVEIPGPTRAAILPETPEPGPLYLQDHGNPVRFRNIWLVPIED